MIQFIEKIIDAEQLIHGFDYAIVSMAALDDDFEIYSVDEWYNIDSLTYFETDRLKNNHYQTFLELLKGLNYHIGMGITPTPHVGNATFYLPQVRIDLSAALTFGLGVVEILRGEYAGQFMLYNFMKMNQEDLIETDALDEILRLKLYFQYTNPFDYYDKGVDFLIRNKWGYTIVLVLNKREQVKARFEEISNYHVSGGGRQVDKNQRVAIVN
ncbi:hypothetical protein M9R32_12010 [Paenisporosarcina quisquiliarum]|uniref:Uncharacterized protein n=1 Tax=Paenisporosarcina quisquiliarum TaxID=365346 RepID=A0A9X3LIB4_9BACL|nr:hypothetical protein [Paenisporosarcina quisquiliarum]MCZ8537910.1 hypothetical protein [Paenisporosarcina quisquiliarum]